MADISKLYRGVKTGNVDYNRLTQQAKDDLFKYRYSIGDINTTKPLNERATNLIKELEPKEEPKKAGFLEQTGYALSGIPEGLKQIYRGTAEKAPAALIGTTAQLFEREEQRQQMIAPEIFEDRGPTVAQRIRTGAETELKRLHGLDVSEAQKRAEYEEEKGIGGVAKHGRMVTQMGTQMAPALLTGSAAFLAPQVFGESAAEGVSRGLTVGEATAQAVPRAGMEVALETIPVEKIGKLFKFGGRLAKETGEEIVKKGFVEGAKEFTKRTVKAAVPEMLEEATSSIANSAMDHYVYGDEFDIKKVLSDAGVESLTAAEMVTLMSALASGVNARRMRRLRTPLEITPQSQQQTEALQQTENVINDVNKQLQQGQIQPSEVTDIINQRMNELTQPKKVTELVKQPDIKNKPETRKSAENELSLLSSAKKSQLTTPTVDDLIDIRTYDKISNIDTIADARAEIGENIDLAMSRFLGNEIRDQRVNNAMGIDLYRQLNNAGRDSDAVNVLNKLADDFKTTGQATQIAVLMSKMTPEGQLLKMQRDVSNVNQAIKEHNERALTNPLLPNIKEIDFTKQDELNLKSDLEKISNFDANSKDKLMEFILQESGVTQLEKNIAKEQVKNIELELDWLKARAVATAYSKIYEKIPQSIGSKISTVQAISHLLNPKTYARNILSNRTQFALEQATTGLGAGIDKLISNAFGTERTVGKKVADKQKIKTLSKESKQKATFDILLGIDKQMNEMDKFRDSTGRYSPKALEKMKAKTGTLKGKLGVVERALTRSLVAPDEMAKTRVEETFLQQQEELGFKRTPELEQEAKKYAEWATFQNDSFLADFNVKTKEWLNFAGINGFGLGDLVIKYTRVPGNIVVRGFEYSPIGFIKGAYGITQINKAAQQGTLTRAQQRQAVMELSRGITGSVAIFGAILLAKMGLNIGNDEENKRMRQLLSIQGLSNDKLNASALMRLVTGKDTGLQDKDLLVSYDWLEPLGALLRAGGDILQGLEKGKGVGEIGTDVLIGQLDMPALSTIKRMIDAGRYADTEAGENPIVEIMKVPIASSASGFVPSVARQTAQLIDPTARQTYDKDQIKKATKSVLGNLPIVRQMLEPQITPTGETREFGTGNIIGNILSGFGPATMNRFSKIDGFDKLSDISEYASPGSSAHLPLAYAPNSIKIKKELIPLNDEQKRIYMETYSESLNKSYLPVLSKIKTEDLTEARAKTLMKRLAELENIAEGKAKKTILPLLKGGE